MLKYSDLTPTRKKFVDRALEIIPSLSNEITRQQIKDILEADQTLFEPQWMWNLSGQQIRRGVYNFPHPTLTPANNIEQPLPINEETDEQIEKRILEDFKTIVDMVEGVCDNIFNSFVIYGGGGIGKTHTVKNTLSRINGGDESKYHFHGGALKFTNLYRLLYENRHKGQVLVLDDVDSIFNDESCLNLLKHALELDETRFLTWGSDYKIKPSDDGEEIPRSFAYQGSIIFLTNKNLKLLQKNDTKNAVHLEAILTRALSLHLNIESNREKLILFKIRVREGILNRILTESEQCEIMDFVESNINDFKTLSLRALEILGKLYKNFPQDWKQHATKMLLK